MSEIENLEFEEIPEDECMNIEDLLNMVLENPEAFSDVIVRDCDYIEYY